MDSHYIQNRIFDVIDIVPPNKINKFIYRCDSKFHTDCIKNLFENSTIHYGLLLISGSETLFYTFDEHLRMKKVSNTTTRIARKHCKGGQSQNRIQRLRDEQIHSYITKIEENIHEYYFYKGKCVVKKIILSGGGKKKEKIQERIKKDVDTVLLSQNTIDELLPKLKEIIIRDDEKYSEKQIQYIQKLIEIEPDRLVFGREEVLNNIDGLEKIWSNKELLSEKTIILDHYYLDSFGCIGMKY